MSQPARVRRLSPPAPAAADVPAPDLRGVGSERYPRGRHGHDARWPRRAGTVGLIAAAAILAVRSTSTTPGPEQPSVEDRAYVAAAANGNNELWERSAADLVALGRALCGSLDRGVDPYELVAHPEIAGAPAEATQLTGATRRYAVLLAASTYCPAHAGVTRQQIGDRPACHAIDDSPACRPIVPVEPRNPAQIAASHPVTSPPGK